MKTIVLANQKGGVGKTAVATLLAQYFARLGKRVLAVDLDHQGNMTNAIALSHRAALATVTAEQLLSVTRAQVCEGRFVLASASDALLTLERQAAMHNQFAQNFRDFICSVASGFDVCVIDTHPNPDIRLLAALVSADLLLSPIQLNQEAIDGVRALLHHPRVGFHKIKALLNPKLALLGLLPALVEATPFQRANFRAIVERHLALLIHMGGGPGNLASIPKRSAIAEAQAEGLLLWEMKKTAARDAWVEIEPSLRFIARLILQEKDVAV